MKPVFTIMLLTVCLCGCVNFKPNLELQKVPETSLPKLSSTKPITIRSVSADTTEMELCAYNPQFKVSGKLHDFSNSALGTVKEALGRRGVVFDEKALKAIDLSVHGVDCKEDMFKFKGTVKLRVKTGDGLEKFYKGESHFGNAYATSWGFEAAIVDSVIRMLNDKDIISYIEK